ncbi:ABC transporter substrate-binding protein [Olsenella sp. HMSC062G07]|uniref:ABC transporter substrate-binding protein n=1 Tax=Olsenella sp. HMSC062G07 TaxID=1739330 RepID=UPI0008A245A6|nr:extracellular solute-binding protein [Olsenella sp. HMSC062G07]OFK22285.1 ABC transporter substrate-binding protein [Olsenella sp. HMSC062G07]
MSVNGWKLSRRSFVGGAGLAVAAGLAACSSGTSSSGGSTSGSDRAGNVYWLNFKPELDATLQKLAGTYMEKYPNVKVKVTTAAAGTYEQTLTSEMDKSDAPTLFVIGNTAGVKEWGDFAMDLKDSDIAKLLSTEDYNLSDDAGKLVSIPYCYECFGIAVNTDLIEKAGHKLDEIKDFASLKAVVEDLHAKAAENGFDAFVATDMDDSSSWRVTGHLTNLMFFYEARDDGGWEEAPATIKGTYVPNYRKLYDLAINNGTVEPSALATGGHDPLTQFTSGKAAFFLTGSFGYADVKDKVTNTACIPYYCGVQGEEKAGLNCGTENCWAINDNASDEDKKATMDFMVWLVSDADAAQAMVDGLGILPYKNAPASANVYLANAQSYADAGNYNLDWDFNYTPNVEQYRANLVSALNAYNAAPSDASWEGVKTAIVDGWATQYKAANA